MKTWMWKIWVVAILPAFTVAAQEVLLFDNTTTDSGYVMNFPNGQETGDQIFLANYMTSPYLNSFSFEYYSPNATFAGTVTADVRFYLNDGSLFNGENTPGTIFYHTGPFEIQTPQSYFPGINSAVLSFSLANLYTDAALPLNPNMPMPSTLTVSMTFQGLEGSDQVGVNLFGPPTVGIDYGDYWFNNGGAWELLANNDGVPVKFAMELDAPEPATLYLTMAGAALLAGFARRRRQ